MKHVELIIEYLIDGEDFQYFDNTGTLVRCKDCKYWGGVLFGSKCTMLSGLDYVIGTKENDYCSYANRKESEEQ